MKIMYNGIDFDDVTKNDEGELWSQICESCRSKHAKKFPDNIIDFDSGSGICGVEGCENISDHYIDFADHSLIEITEISQYELKRFWEDFGEIEINDDDEIMSDFLCFLKGTDRFEIWQWFDKKLENGLKNFLNIS